AFALQDLEGLRVVDAARRAEREALRRRVERVACGEVAFALCECFFRVRNRAAFDDAGAWRCVGTRSVCFEAVVGCAQRLPDSGEIRMAFGRARDVGVCARGRCEEQGSGGETAQRAVWERWIPAFAGMTNLRKC